MKEIIEGKYIVFPKNNLDCMPEKFDTVKAVELKHYNKMEFSKFWIIFNLLFKKGFKTRLQRVVKYGYRHSEFTLLTIRDIQI